MPPRAHGSPRVHADLVEEGWKVSEKTVADSMRRQGLVARRCHVFCVNGMAGLLDEFGQSPGVDKREVVQRFGPVLA